MVTLWESRPKIIEKKMEDESIVKEVVMDEFGRPVIDTRLRGVSTNLVFKIFRF